jgi:hypothetical protein
MDAAKKGDELKFRIELLANLFRPNLARRHFAVAQITTTNPK